MHNMTIQIKLRRDTAANWTSANSILALGEPGIETDTTKVKYGDGTTAWVDLAYSAGSTGQQGVKGDTGDQGIQGIQGIKGDTGDQGIQGIKGDTGDQGIQGIQGIKGDTGDQGIQGIQGIQGVQGVKGDTGSGVPTGGTANQVLAKIDGIDFNTRWVNATTGSSDVKYEFASSNFTANAAKTYVVNTSSAEVTITLPATPATGDWVKVYDGELTFSTNNLIVDGNGNDIRSVNFVPGEAMTYNSPASSSLTISQMLSTPIGSLPITFYWNGSVWTSAS